MPVINNCKGLQHNKQCFHSVLNSKKEDPMKAQKLIENNLDEVIFEKRNKEYGAYFLRKSYEKNVSGALTIAITLLLLVVAIPLIANYIHTERLIRETTVIEADVINIDKPKDEIKPPELPPLPEVIAPRVIFRVPKIIDDTNGFDPIFTQDDLNDQTKNDKLSDTFITVVDDQKDKKIIDQDQDNQIYIITGISEKPFFPGGDEGLNKFITDNTKYPELARENRIQGTVFVKFVVEKDGTISNIKVHNGIGAGCDEEAVRVIKLMPDWIPGKMNNKNVRVEILIPMKFIVVQ
jgi:protein TonB